MATEASKFRVGVFVTAGVVILLAAVFLFGASRYLQETRTYATYFRESVQGLEINAPVKFRGLNVGRVSAIRIAPDGKLIEVLMQIDQDKFKPKKSHIIMQRTANISGVKYLEVEMREGREQLSPALSFTSAYPVIPSHPSAQITEILDTIKKQFDDIDARGISVGLTTVLARVNELLDRGRWEPIVSNAHVTAAALGLLSSELQAYVVAGALSNLVNNATAAAQHLRALSARLDNERVEALLHELTELVARLNQIAYSTESSFDPVLQDLQRSAANLRSFTEQLKTRPSQTLFGSPTKEEQQ